MVKAIINGAEYLYCGDCGRYTDAGKPKRNRKEKHICMKCLVSVLVKS